PPCSAAPCPRTRRAWAARRGAPAASRGASQPRQRPARRCLCTPPSRSSCRGQAGGGSRRSPRDRPPRWCAGPRCSRAILRRMRATFEGATISVDGKPLSVHDLRVVVEPDQRAAERAFEYGEAVVSGFVEGIVSDGIRSRQLLADAIDTFRSPPIGIESPY